ncbi:hypothetical protein NHE_0711 [Neorickettsia helminthoeca str. Oregon]|uniref:Uncharacterized protein n=1 Tax=Neorickettsia helminthoeca str. Oregon TaxID=1286528 RepID=X5HKQ8_9RICK|nr:hypothetical protein [Neorickettsia helminthoeca]AHX11644.1 hypothetical protein NHE_0711 [Neorickettsia helminthoeca str. Oregon]
MVKQNEVSLQKLDFALKKLEKVIQRRLQLEEIKRHQECEKLAIEIAELKRQAKLHMNEIKMLKTIIKEAVANIDEVIEIIEKIHDQV